MNERGNKMDIPSLVWIDFYSEFAETLCQYAQDRLALIEKIKQVYQTIQMKLPTLERDNQLEDIDPFTVFGLFNKGITDANRVKIMKGFADAFHIKAPVPDQFVGVPAMNNQMATFYWFKGGRGERDIDNLWGIFLAALEYSKTHSEESRGKFIHFYDTVIQQKGVKWNITMGLFWIAPYEFINLDSRSRWYILLPDKMPTDLITPLGTLNHMPSGEEYLNFSTRAREALRLGTYPYKNFPELSCYAWKVSQKVNEDKKAGQLPVAKNDIGSGLANRGVDSVHYWLYSPGNNACMWDEFRTRGIMAIGWGEIGDLNEFVSKDEIKQKMKACFGEGKSYKNAAHAVWQFLHEMKPGDIVFVKKGMYSIVGRGVVQSDYEYEADREDEFRNVRQVNWTHNGEWPHPGQAAMKTLTDITPYTDYVEKLKAFFEEEDADDEEETETEFLPYTQKDFLKEVYMTPQNYDTLCGLLKRKKNIILQGAPGVGKTYTAQRLAYSIMGVKDQSRVMMVQFHQNYGYEDFVMGFRPRKSDAGFELKEGPFYKFCKAAEIDSENPYFFIIDEINRGNLSKIFGELFMMIEADKRGNALRLLYSDELFSIPQNVHLIGTMNTADRSLAMIDYALRRRFAFFEMMPAFDVDTFVQEMDRKQNPKYQKLIRTVKAMNEDIKQDAALGRGFCVGHSYFCTEDTVDDVWLSGVVEYELLPLLQEYWFDNPDKTKEWQEKLREAIR